MRAAIFKTVGEPLVVESVADPSPGPGEVVIRVARCGICGSDVHLTRSHDFGTYAGSVLGHEMAGDVVALGQGVETLRVGDRIAALPMAGCGHCEACRSGDPFVCPQHRMMMGGFAEYALAHANYAALLPGGISFDEGALVEPLAAALHCVASSGLRPGARVAILGAGAIGLAIAFWARRRGAGHVIAVARSAWRAPLALAMGASAFIESNVELVANVCDVMRAAPDIVFEAAGVPGMTAQAIALVRSRGTVMMAGMGMEPDPYVPSHATFKEVTLRFAAAYTAAEFREVVEVLANGAPEARRLVTATLPLDAMPGALEAMRSGHRQCKVMIDPWMRDA